MFDIEKRVGREFIDTGRLKKNFLDLGEGGGVWGGAIFKCNEENEKVSSFLLFDHSHPCSKQKWLYK